MNLSKLFRYVHIAIIAMFALLSTNSAIITEINSLHEVAAYLNAAAVKDGELAHACVENPLSEPKTLKPLCALDIDFTITRPSHPATDPSNFQKFARLFMSTISEEGLNPVDVMFATTLTEQQLMEPNTKEIIAELNSLATVIGLTARYAGEFAGVDMEEHTAAMLESFDTSMDQSIDDRTTFEELTEYRGNKPVLNKGILFCNGEKGSPVTKPEVLAAYIKTCGIPYTKIIVVDDTKKHLDDCAAYFAGMPGIEFQGFHYIRAARDEPRACTQEEFLAYLGRLIRFLKPAVAAESDTADELAAAFLKELAAIAAL